MVGERMASASRKVEGLLAPVFSRAGYKQVDASVYKALWSTDEVEHFIYLFENMKAGSNLLKPDFGIRNPGAEAFSVHSIRKYGGELFSIWKHNEATSCTMGFSFARLEPASWPASNLSGQRLIDTFERSVTERLLPFVRHITTFEKLLQLLVSDEPMFPWAGCNGAIRAAQIVALAGHLGIDPSEVSTWLECRLLNVANGLSKTSELRSDPKSYLARVQNDWGAQSLTAALP
jgi:hypothetical protein